MSSFASILYLLQPCGRFQFNGLSPYDTMEYPLDRSHLLRYAQSGRFAARRSAGTWLMMRSTLQALIRGLTARAEALAWAASEMTPALATTLTEIDNLRAQMSALERPAALAAHSLDPHPRTGPVSRVAIYILVCANHPMHTNTLPGSGVFLKVERPTNLSADAP